MSVRVIQVLLVMLATTRATGQEKDIQPALPVLLESKDLGQGWTAWNGIVDLNGINGAAERATALHVTAAGDVWIGTSIGRLLRRSKEKWSVESILRGQQVTGMAVQDDTLWLSTSDGVCRLKPVEGGWKRDQYVNYYEGHPLFVSGGYIPGQDSVRRWGFVDGIFIPPGDSIYAPFVISTEHGLFSWGHYHGVWHHFLPHYWGGNSDWLDTRELLPHRRPTCMIEDTDGNLWIGSDGDGIVRMNHHARAFHQRSPAENAKDGQEFTRFDSGAVGCEFATVLNAAPGLGGGAWFTLADREKRRYVARFDGQAWSIAEMPKTVRKTLKAGQVVGEQWWEGTPLAIVEAEQDVALVGVQDNQNRSGLMRVDWKDKSFHAVPRIEHAVRRLARSPDGSIWAVSWFGVFQGKLSN